MNLVSWIAFAAAILGASAIAGTLGASARAQCIGALFCATLPGAILQASGPKNDLLLALWLVCAMYFELRGNIIMCGLSFGLALATKGTAYVFVSPLLLAVVALTWHRDKSVRWLSIAAAVLGSTLLINAPQYWRNLRLSGSPLGFNSPFGDDTFTFRNKHLGWKSAFERVATRIRSVGNTQSAVESSGA